MIRHLPALAIILLLAACSNEGVITNKGPSRDDLVDKIPPETMIFSGPAALINQADVEFSFRSDEDDVSFVCVVDGSIIENCESPLALTLTDGSHTFLVKAVDAAGNEDLTPAELAFAIDTLAPTISIDQSPDEFTNQVLAQFVFSADESDVTLECNLDSAGFLLCDFQSEFDLSSQPDGSHQIEVRGMDMAGNLSAIVSHSWTIDRTQPDTVIDASPLLTTNDSSAIFQFHAVDELGDPLAAASFSCRIDASAPTDPFVPCSSGDEFGPVSDGSHTFEVKATSLQSGLEDPVPASFTWSVDATPAETFLTFVPSNPSGQAVRFEFSSDEGAATFECRLDASSGGTFNSCTSPISYVGLSLNDSHQFEVRSIDGAGNVDLSPSTYTWNVALGATDVVDISIGFRDSCHVAGDGKIRCWGNGTGSPTAIDPGIDWIGVDTNFDYLCGLNVDRQIFCMGQLFATIDLPSMTAVNGETNWVDVSIGDEHVCGRKQDGSIFCWGSGIRLGRGSSQGGSLTPLQEGSQSVWTAMSVGSRHTCAIKDNGTLWCWGANESGQLGVPVGSSADVIQVGSDSNWEDVSAGDVHSCATKTNGDLYCWGDNTSGQLGTGSFLNEAAPALVPSSGSWLSVSTGLFHTCAIDSSDALFCFGENDEAQVGNNLFVDQNAPALVQMRVGDGSNNNWIQVDAGDTTTCGIRSDHSARCWGESINAGIGLGNRTLPLVQEETQSADWASVTRGCATKTDGSRHCAGTSAIIPNGRSDAFKKVELASDPTFGDSWQTDLSQECGIKQDGHLFCGASDFGTGWAQVSTSQVSAHACALNDSGSIYCWGANSVGQLGTDDFVPRTAPTLISDAFGTIPNSNYNSIGVYGASSCATKLDRTIYCWGLSTTAAGVLSFVKIPIVVNGGAKAKKDWVRMAKEGPCAHNLDGTVSCRAYKNFGKQMSTSSWNVLAGAADGLSACGVLSDGSLSCSDEAGVLTELQPGSWLDYSSTSKVQSLANEGCAIRSDATLRCFGTDLDGIFGDGHRWEEMPTALQ